MKKKVIYTILFCIVSIIVYYYFLQGRGGVFMKKFFSNLRFNKVNWIIFLLNLIVSIGFFVTEGFSLWSFIGLIAGVTNILCVIFVANKDIRNYPFGIMAVVYYAFVSYYYGNTGEWMLSMFCYVPMNVIGWSLWIKSLKASHEKGAAKDSTKEDENIVESRKLNIKQIGICLVVLSAAVIGYAQLLGGDVLQMMVYGELTNHPISKYYVDSFTTMASVLAMFLQLYRFMEQWYLWIIINVMSIVLWVMTPNGGALMIVMWASLLLNSVYGLIIWKRGVVS